jgi:hypothetical protein
VSFASSLGIPESVTVPGTLLVFTGVAALVVANAIAVWPAVAAGREHPAALLRTD